MRIKNVEISNRSPLCQRSFAMLPWLSERFVCPIRWPCKLLPRPNSPWWVWALVRDECASLWCHRFRTVSPNRWHFETSFRFTLPLGQSSSIPIWIIHSDNAFENNGFLHCESQRLILSVLILSTSMSWSSFACTFCIWRRYNSFSICEIIMNTRACLNFIVWNKKSASSFRPNDYFGLPSFK